MSGQASELPLRETPGCLVLEFGRMTPHELGELYRAFAVLCIEKQFRRALILAGDDDRAGDRALRVAVTMMLLAGIPRDFRLALVTASAEVAATYHAAPSDICAAGVAARLFDSRQDATHWLEGRSASTGHGLEASLDPARRGERARIRTG